MNPSRMFQLQITDADGNVRVVPLPATASIGRQEGNDLLLDDQRVSRQHAVIECTDETCHITDLGSSNGTVVDGERLTPNVPVEFRSGSTARIDSFELVLEAIALPEPVEVEVAPPEPEPVPPRPDAETPLDLGGTRVPPPGSPVVAPPGDIPEDGIPPGLALESRRLINYLPGIYHTPFMARFLGIFEAILTPVEWNVDNFDLYLDPGTTPRDFISWLAGWFDITFDRTWSESRRRELLREAHSIYARRGTKWALSRTLEIYTGYTPTIIDTGPGIEPFTFKVSLPIPDTHLEREMVERLIDAHKPAHALYTLELGE